MIKNKSRVTLLWLFFLQPKLKPLMDLWHAQSGWSWTELHTYVRERIQGVDKWDVCVWLRSRASCFFSAFGTVRGYRDVPKLYGLCSRYCNTFVWPHKTQLKYLQIAYFCTEAESSCFLHTSFSMVFLWECHNNKHHIVIMRKPRKIIISKKKKKKKRPFSASILPCSTVIYSFQNWNIVVGQLPYNCDYVNLLLIWLAQL